ncbi:hypothetical protein GRO11_002585, partial [Campylobacter jejuni]|nr:hypothetical protein [Campylobacter jejuni]
PPHPPPPPSPPHPPPPPHPHTTHPPNPPLPPPNLAGGRNFSNHPKVKSIFLGLHKLLIDVLHRV